MGFRRIKVCHVASGDLWAGAEVQVATLLSYLIEQPEFDVYAVVLNEGQLADELRKCGTHVTVIDETKTSTLLLLKKFLRYFRLNKVDILHTHRYKENVLGSITAKLIGIPYVVRTVHGLPEPFSGFNRAKMAVYRYVDDLAVTYIVDKVIAVSSDIERTLRRKYSGDIVRCIHNSVELSKLKAIAGRMTTRSQLQIPQGGKVIGSVGRLTSVKCIEDLLHAAAIICGERSNVTFLIAGDGPLRQSLEGLAKEWQIEQCIRFLGHREDVYDLINIMDIVVMPSAHEGLPTVLLEALAMGKPVVATRVGGIGEVVKQDELGILVEPKDPAQLAAACLLLLDRSGDKFGVARRQYIAREFSSGIGGAKVVKLYKELIAVSQ